MRVIPAECIVRSVYVYKYVWVCGGCDEQNSEKRTIEKEKKTNIKIVAMYFTRFFSFFAFYSCSFVFQYFAKQIIHFRITESFFCLKQPDGIKKFCEGKSNQKLAAQNKKTTVTMKFKMWTEKKRETLRWYAWKLRSAHSLQNSPGSKISRWCRRIGIMGKDIHYTALRAVNLLFAYRAKLFIQVYAG